MSITRSPVTPLVLALLLRCFLPEWRSRTVLIIGLFWYAIARLWTWWRGFVVRIDGVVYKEPWSAATPRVQASSLAGLKFQPGRRREGPFAGKEGFTTPREEDDEDDEASPKEETPPFSAEFAPWTPSLPYGKPTTAKVPAQPYWKACDASVFDVRNIRYKQTKEKVSSDFALYDCVGMDMIRDRRRVDAVVDRIPGGAACGPLPQSPAGSPAWSPAWGVPRVVVTNCQLPYKTGWLMGGHPEDDGGLSVCNYFVLSRRASEILAGNKTTPALRLLRRFAEEGVSTKDGVSFKVLGRVKDLEKFEVPESFHKFNNKPVLLTKSSRVITSRLPEVLEIDYDIRTWVYPARSALSNYHHLASEAELEIGYLIEGKADDELPEQILGCFTLYDMDITQATWLPPS